MTRPELNLLSFRRLARFTLWLSVVLVVFGLFQLLPNTTEAFGTPTRLGESNPTFRITLGLLAIVLGVLALFPSQYFRIRPDREGEDLLLFVTRSECTLCDEARLLLPRITEGTPFRIEEVSIETNRFLRRHFRHAIPVLLWQGEELARLRWDAEALRAQLQAIVARRKTGKSPDALPPHPSA